MFAPKLKDYEIGALAALGNKEINDVKRNQIKLTIIEKLLKSNCSMFFLVNSFLGTYGMLKEAYAEVIVMLMKDIDYLIDEVVIDDIVKYVSLDVLSSYGTESRNSLFANKCVSEFWNRAHDIEDKNELNNKSGVKKRSLRNIFDKKRKGDIK